jgi:hypothetical protein
MSFRFAVSFLVAASATHAYAQDPSGEVPAEPAPEEAAPAEVEPALEEEPAQPEETAPQTEERPAEPAGDALAEPPVETMIDPTPDQVIEEEEEESPAPWRGSEVEFRNQVGVMSFDPAAELTYNPAYAIAFSFRPRWWFGDKLNLRARFDLSTELTDADDTTYRNEAQPSDLWLSVGASPLYTIPVVEIDIAPDLRFVFPTSKLSQYRNLILAVSPGVAFQRVFEFGESHSLTVAYRLRFSFLFNSSTTSEIETPRIAQEAVCDPEGPCGQFLNSGSRNPQYSLSHGIDVTYQPLAWFGVGFSLIQYFDWLYPFENDIPEISYEEGADTTTRYRTGFSLEATFNPFDALEIGFGAETLAPQLADDSTYYFPLFNRSTVLYLDLRLKVDGLVDMIRGASSDTHDEDI